MLLKKLFLLLFQGNILNPLKIVQSSIEHESREYASNSPQPSLSVNRARQLAEPNNNAAVGSPANVNHALAANNAEGIVPHGKPPAGICNGVASVDGSILNGNVTIDIPEKLDGTTQGTKHPMKPISEIEEGQKITNGQYPGSGVQFPPEQSPVLTGPSQFTENLTDIRRPLIGNYSRSSKPLEILKSIVYGGLMELITSLSIVSSAAASDATTLNIVVLGLANLLGGLLVLGHELKDLRYEEYNHTNEEVKSRYQELLGRKENFLLQMTFALLSYLAFGIIPPVIYGFTFPETNHRGFKLLAVAASSLVCIVILAIAKAYTRGQHKLKAYCKTVMYYVTCAVMASGIAYAVAYLFKSYGEAGLWFDSNPVEHLLIPKTKDRTSN